MWRSLVAHLHGVQGVEGSNPFTPTIRYVKSLQAEMLGGFFHWEIKGLYVIECQGLLLTDT